MTDRAAPDPATSDPAASDPAASDPAASDRPASDPAAPAAARPVRLLTAGGTISMQGDRAVPVLDAAGLLAATGARLGPVQLHTEDVLHLPSAHLSLAQAHDLARRAAAAAADGEGVVLTTGTDTLEELAMLCALHHDASSPVVLTGANRPAAAPGADGPANLADAITLAAAPSAADLGTVVVFGGEILPATAVRKIDSTGPAAFGAPVTGPLGRIVDGRAWVAARPVRPPVIAPARLAGRVPIVTAALGEDGSTLRAAAEAADGVVLVAFGAGHLNPELLEALEDTAGRIPVVVTVRPERGSMLHGTYGFVGSERDVRACRAIAAPFLSAVAARIVLLACLGAGLGDPAMREAFAPFDA